MEIVTQDLKDRIYKIYETYEEMVEAQADYIERLRAEAKQLRQENRLIDKNAAAVQKELKKEVESLQAENIQLKLELEVVKKIKAVLENDLLNAKMNLEHIEAERERAVQDLKEISGGEICHYCGGELLADEGYAICPYCDDSGIEGSTE